MRSSRPVREIVVPLRFACRLPRAVSQERSCLACLLLVVILALSLPLPLQAQRADSARAGASRRSGKPPISPRRAFVYSLLVPGLGQASLDRGTSAAAFFFVDAASLLMAQKALGDLRRARSFGRDTIVVAYQTDTLSSSITIRDPLTGEMLTPVCPPGTLGNPVLDTSRRPFPIKCAPKSTSQLVRARRTHYEDWVALIIFNHIISGAEAFVSAHLWDLPAQVGITPHGGGATVSASIAW